MNKLFNVPKIISTRNQEMYKNFKYSQHDLPCINGKQLSFTNIVVTDFAKIYVASTYNILQSLAT